jgi:hypothetical protein
LSVFTPNDEPYLGLGSLLAFDKTIVASLAANTDIARQTRLDGKSRLQLAACQIIPSGISLALSIRELLRQGYVYGALVLLRPLTERTMTIVFLRMFPEEVAVWDRGWLYNERPSLAKMIEKIGGAQFPGVGREMTKAMNGLIHGDPDSAQWNTIFGADGVAAHPVGKILERPDLCSKAALEAGSWLAVLITSAIAIFPSKIAET